MQCEDNSKLRTPLSEVCQTTDIGCVPITDGKPTCSPQPDELPFAFDPKTTTLWIFSCKNHEWINFTKFTMCQLDALNLDNITNICDMLNIGVNYSGSGECKQGTVTLAELAERILECLKLETKIITIGEGEGNKVKISIEGLPLDPVYVTGRNIWSEGGSGTETDPLKIATYDPICKWPVRTQGEVDASSVKHLGACLDGEMSRVPFPPKICELPARNQGQVDNALSVELGACVDGEEVRIPYIKPSPPVCEADQITLEQARQKGTDLTIVGCDNLNVVRIPVSQSGFFDRDYICVPQVIEPPQGAPPEGTGPLRIGCNGELYVWLCESGGWVEVRNNPNSLSPFDPGAVSNLCENFRLMGWYSNISGDPCVEQVKLTLSQLAQSIQDCFGWWNTQIPPLENISDGCNNLRFMTFYNDDGGNRVNGYVTTTQLLDSIKKCSPNRCERVFSENIYNVYPLHPDGSSAPEFGLKSVTLANPSTVNWNSNTYDYKLAIWNFWRRRWDCGSGTFDDDTQPIIDAGFNNNDDGKGTVGRWVITLDNTDSECPVDYAVSIAVRLGGPLVASDKDFSVCLRARLREASSHNPYAQSESFNNVIGTEAGPTLYHASTGYHSKFVINTGPSAGPIREDTDVFNTSRAVYLNTSGRERVYTVSPGESMVLHLHAFFVIMSRTETTIDNMYPNVLRGGTATAVVRKYRRLMI